MIPTTENYLQALVRSEAYRDDYEACAAALAAWEIPGDDVNERDATRVMLATDAPEVLEEGEAFLRRWPTLLHPIPPYRALRDPDRFLPYLHGPVEVVRDEDPARWVDEKIGDFDDLERLVLSSDLRDGRFLVARVDATRPEAEIFTALGEEIKKYRKMKWGLPPVAARTSKHKESRLNLSARRWEVFDVYVERGCDVRETAARLCPEEYDLRVAKREAREAATRFLEAKGVSSPRELLSRDLVSHERLVKARVTPERLARRMTIEREIRRIVKVCEAATEAIKPR